MIRVTNNKNTRGIVDVFQAYLVETADFDGNLEMPLLLPVENVKFPKIFVPFTKRKQAISRENFLCFYEHDYKFQEVLDYPEDYVEEFRQYGGIVTPDCSLYWDMPFTKQIASVYQSRAIGYYFQSRGITVIPNVRWGDERTYTTNTLPEKIAFLGIPKNSIVSIGTYGCIRTKEATHHFREGLREMLETVSPKTIFVYGAMPEKIFGEFQDKWHFVQYPDWVTIKRGRNANGDNKKRIIP